MVPWLVLAGNLSSHSVEQGHILFVTAGKDSPEKKMNQAKKWVECEFHAKLTKLRRVII